MEFLPGGCPVAPMPTENCLGKPMAVLPLIRASKDASIPWCSWAISTRWQQLSHVVEIRHTHGVGWQGPQRPEQQLTAGAIGVSYVNLGEAEVRQSYPAPPAIVTTSY
jgi:hypothetical protein